MNTTIANKEAQELLVIQLYRNWITCWNNKDAAAMRELLAEAAYMIGFDGSQMDGAKEIESTLADIFSQYPTGLFVPVIKEVRFLSNSVAMLRAAAGMVPRGYDDINPNVNAFQTLVATLNEGEWEISLFQNTPAAFHGQPEKAQELSAELRAELKKTKLN